MASFNQHIKQYDHPVIKVDDLTANTTTLSIKADGEARYVLFADRETLEQLFGVLNNYFESTTPTPTINDLVKERAENEAPYSLA
jgi:hypothetical protein